jgi:cell division initiation protein
MIDLTPLEVRKKKGDFRRIMRGYDPALVDDFLDMVADRMEQLVRQNLSVNERLSVLESQVSDFKEREKALTEALVTAQEMRTEIREQVQKEADIARREAESQAETIRVSALTARQKEEEAIRRLRARQMQLLGSYRSFLERELAELTVMAETLEVQRSRPVFMEESLPGDEELDMALETPRPAAAPARPAAPPPAPTRAHAPETATSGKTPVQPLGSAKLEPEEDAAPTETAWVSTLIERKL